MSILHSHIFLISLFQLYNHIIHRLKTLSFSFLNSWIRNLSILSKISKFYEHMSIFYLTHKNRKIRPHLVPVLVTKILIFHILIKTSNTANFTKISNRVCFDISNLDFLTQKYVQ